MLGKKSKVFVMIGMLALLTVTGVLNVVLNNNAQAASADVLTSSDFFVTYRNDRTQTRNETVLYLDAIIKSSDSTEAEKSQATAQKFALTEAMENELRVEGLIKAAGFEDAVVTTTGQNVNVILKSGTLTDEQANMVLAIVVDETGKKANSVRIIPIE